MYYHKKNVKCYSNYTQIIKCLLKPPVKNSTKSILMMRNYVKHGAPSTLTEIVKYLFCLLK